MSNVRLPRTAGSASRSGATTPARRRPTGLLAGIARDPKVVDLLDALRRRVERERRAS